MQRLEDSSTPFSVGDHDSEWHLLVHNIHVNYD